MGLPPVTGTSYFDEAKVIRFLNGNRCANTPPSPKLNKNEHFHFYNYILSFCICISLDSFFSK